jgi:hypothetical protein
MKNVIVVENNLSAVAAPQFRFRNMARSSNPGTGFADTLGSADESEVERN